MARATLGVSNNGASTHNIIGVSIKPRQMPSHVEGAVPTYVVPKAPPFYSGNTPIGPNAGAVNLAAGASSTPVDVEDGPYVVTVTFKDVVLPQSKEVVMAAVNVVVDFTG